MYEEKQLKELSREELEELVTRVEDQFEDFKAELEARDDAIEELKIKNEELTKKYERQTGDLRFQDWERSYVQGKVDALWDVLHDVMPILIGMSKED